MLDPNLAPAPGVYHNHHFGARCHQSQGQSQNEGQGRRVASENGKFHLVVDGSRTHARLYIAAARSGRPYAPYMPLGAYMGSIMRL